MSVSHVSNFPNTNIARRVFVLAGILSVAGCATTPLPEPANKENSLVIVGLRVESHAMLMNQVTYEAGKLVLRRTDAQGAPVRISQTEIVSNYPNGQYFVFANVPPGTYQIDLFTKDLPGAVAPSHPDYSLVFTFSPKVTNDTTVRVPPRSIAYVGDLTVRYKQRVVPPPLMFRYDVAEAGGERSEKGKMQALEVFRKRYGDSPWSGYTAAP